MKANMTTSDRSIRFVAGLILLYLAFAATGMGAVLLAISITFLATSITGFCPLYKLFGIDFHEAGENG